MNWNDYQRPKDVSEALRLLEQAEGRGRIVAGGTDLILQLQQGQLRADLLVDITDIQELKHIQTKDGWIHIGAGVTHAEVAKNPLIQKEARALAEGCGYVGSPQVRNVATLVGNVVSAQPAGDGAIPLMALEAELKAVSKEGARWVPLEKAYRGIGLSSINPFAELATEVKFKKLGELGNTRFFRMARRRSLALPILNGAVVIMVNASRDRIEKARIAIGPVAEKPFRPRSAEAFLESEAISRKVILEAARIASEEANPRTSLLRGSEYYRKEMVRLYLVRMVQKILEGVEGKRD